MTDKYAKLREAEAHPGKKAIERMQRISEASGIQTIWPLEATDMLALLASEKARADAVAALAGPEAKQFLQGILDDFSREKQNRVAAEATIASLSEQLAEALETAAQIAEVNLTRAMTRKTEVGQMLHYLDGKIIREIASAIRELKPSRATLSRLEKQEGEK